MPEMILDARAAVDLAPPPVLGGGVLSVARVVDVTDPHQLMGAEAFTDACATAEEWAEWCTMAPTGVKPFEGGPTYITGDPFAVYTGVECALEPMADHESRARTRLGYTEGRAIDAHFDALLGAQAMDLGGPFTLAEGIGLAEAYAATIYGGVPTLLIPRQVVPCECGRAIYGHMDGSLTTCAGSRVAPITVPVTLPPTGTVTMYVTGQITLLRGQPIVISVPPQPLDAGAYAPARALAERIYVPLFDCLAARVEVSCSATP